MKKIVIINEQPDQDLSLAETLSEMFPECDIQVVSRYSRDGRPLHPPAETTGAGAERTMKRVLVIDDEISIQLLYAQELAEEGYDVILSDGDRVMELIGETRPDLVVMEIDFQKINGLELLEGIRSTFDLPVIVNSGHPALQLSPKMVHADGFVPKSSSLRRLKEMIQLQLHGTDRYPAAAPEVNWVPADS